MARAGKTHAVFNSILVSEMRQRNKISDGDSDGVGVTEQRQVRTARGVNLRRARHVYRRRRLRLPAGLSVTLENQLHS